MIRNLRPTGSAIIAGLALLTLVAGALPARAGDTSWSDPPNDADGGGQFSRRTPLPSNAALDITKSTLSSDGTDLSWVVKVKDLPDSGYGGQSTGLFFILGFRYANTAFAFRVGEDQVAGEFFDLIPYDPSRKLECDGCGGVIDRKTDSVIVTAPLAALAAGLNEALSDDAPPLGPGSRLSSLYVASHRNFASTVTVAADDSQTGITHTV